MRQYAVFSYRHLKAEKLKTIDDSHFIIYKTESLLSEGRNNRESLCCCINIHETKYTRVKTNTWLHRIITAYLDNYNYIYSYKRKKKLQVSWLHLKKLIEVLQGEASTNKGNLLQHIHESVLISQCINSTKYYFWIHPTLFSFFMPFYIPSKGSNVHKCWSILGPGESQKLP